VGIESKQALLFFKDGLGGKFSVEDLFFAPQFLGFKGK
jgi:hypothetical protein